MFASFFTFDTASVKIKSSQQGLGLQYSQKNFKEYPESEND
jgi:hypothetical protein